MDFALSAEQQQFASALHDMLAAADAAAAARSWAAGDRKPGLEIWRSLSDAGVTALMVPPEHGGLGADPVDLVIACEEIGHHAVPGPVAESLAAVPKLLAAGSLSWGTASPVSGTEGFASALPMKGAGAHRAEPVHWLRQLAEGELIASLACPPWLPLAADADAAGLVLVAEPGSVRVGTVGHSHRSVEAARTVSQVSGGDLIAAGPAVTEALARALDCGALACAAQLLGAGRALLELTALHARQRVQFGQPIGSFQAVKHHLADVLIGLEFARPLLFGAAIALATESADAGRDVSAAKVACADAASLAARIALQVHGAIGYTAEHDVSMYLTKIRALAPAWGSQALHRARLLAALTSAHNHGSS
jgi:alkylation response protein AidB-like acyl-CoA dehydrogenase